MTKFSTSLLFFCFLAVFVFHWSAANAAEFRLESESSAFAVGDEFFVTVQVDTEGESINAFEGNVVFPQELLELKRIQEKDSIVNLWVAEPPAFSGLTPGGYVGEGVLFSLIFEAKAQGQGNIAIEQGRVLLNDGEGTKAPLEIFNFQFSIFNQDSSSQVSKVGTDDTEAPEPFELRVAQDPAVFDGQPFLVFAARDKNSGIDHYEAAFSRDGRTTEWEQVVSPLLLERYEEIEFIRVKAVDRAGNERIALLSFKHSNPPYAIIGIFGILGASGIAFIVWRKRKHTPKRIIGE